MTGRTLHLVQFSTGASSAEVAWRLVDEHGPGAVLLMSANTRKEDPDNWRFGHEVAARLGCLWVILCEGRTPMQVGLDERCVPNNRWAVCSKYLKRKLMRAYIDARFDPGRCPVYIGYDWSEPQRIADARRHWEPVWQIRAPLADDPPGRPGPHDLFRSRGIGLPSLYADGFAHANCGGACVRGGQAPWALLLRTHRDRYLAWERDEEETRAALGKDVSILRDRTASWERAPGKSVRPLTLARFRERLDAQQPFDFDDWGACGCDLDSDLAPGEIEHDARRPASIDYWRAGRWHGRDAGELLIAEMIAA